jgi:hypothetical protein
MLITRRNKLVYDCIMHRGLCCVVRAQLVSLVPAEKIVVKGPRFVTLRDRQSSWERLEWRFVEC